MFKVLCWPHRIPRKIYRVLEPNSGNESHETVASILWNCYGVFARSRETHLIINLPLIDFTIQTIFDTLYHLLDPHDIV